MINYSFIIPHKNIPKLLERCVNSIPNRPDIEIIIIDDNSDDIEILRSMETLKKDNVHLICISKEESKGAGYARNKGIDIAQGKCFVFADADDFFLTDALNNKMDEYIDSLADIVFFNVECLLANTFMPAPNADIGYRNFIEAENATTLCRYKLKVPWGKFVKRSLIVSNNIRFDETKVANDLIFSLKTGIAAEVVEVDKTSIYTWLVREGSLTSIKTKEAAYLHFDASVRYNLILKRNSLEDYRKYRNNLFFSLPNLHRNSFSYMEIFKMIFRNTPTKYLITDFFKAIIAYIKKENTSK